MVLANESSEIWPDLAGSFKSCGLGGCFLIFCWNVGAFRVMLQIAEDADGKYVPGRALIAHKDEVLRLLQSLGVSVFHLALFVQIGELARQGDEHLDVKERAAGKRL